MNSSGSVDPGQDYVSSEDYTPLVGELPKETALLTELVDFIIYGMEVKGTITNKFSNATGLQDLVLSNTTLTGNLPDELPMQNPNLRKLILSDNFFNGTIPTSFGTLKKLVDFQLDGNKLSGSIADDAFASLDSLSKLTLGIDRVGWEVNGALFGSHTLCLSSNTGILELQSNNITGALPSSLYTRPNLQLLRLDGNPIPGRLQSDIGQLLKLSELRLGSSEMGGEIPPELFQLPALQILDLSNAKFNGTLSEEVGSLNDTLKSLLLNDNSFSGPVPQALGTFGVLGTSEAWLVSCMGCILSGLWLLLCPNHSFGSITPINNNRISGAFWKSVHRHHSIRVVQ